MPVPSSHTNPTGTGKTLIQCSDLSRVQHEDLDVRFPNSTAQKKPARGMCMQHLHLARNNDKTNK